MSVFQVLTGTSGKDAGDFGGFLPMLFFSDHVDSHAPPPIKDVEEDFDDSQSISATGSDLVDSQIPAYARAVLEREQRLYHENAQNHGYYQAPADCGMSSVETNTVAGLSDITSSHDTKAHDVSVLKQYFLRRKEGPRDHVIASSKGDILEEIDNNQVRLYFVFYNVTKHIIIDVFR